MVKCGIFGVLKSKHGKEGCGTHTWYCIHNMVVKYVTTWRSVVFCGMYAHWNDVVLFAHWYSVVNMLIGIVW